MFLKNKSEFDRLASIALIHNNQKFHHKDIALYDFIKDDYKDIDDELRKYLKEIKVSYSHEEVSTFNPLEGSIDDQNQEQETRETGLNPTITYDKITISRDKDTAFAYKVYISTGGK